MAEIVTLNTWRKSHPPKSPRVEIGRPGHHSGRSAERLSLEADVLIFTGVRYERFDDRMDRKAENHAVRIEQN